MNLFSAYYNYDKFIYIRLVSYNISNDVISSIKVQGYVTRVKGGNIKMYSISTSFCVNNQGSFVFWKMTSFGNIRCYFAITASKPCFMLYVIHLVVPGLFSMFLVLMYSAEWALCCYVYIYYIVYLKSCWNRIHFKFSSLMQVTYPRTLSV